MTGSTIIRMYVRRFFGFGIALSGVLLILSVQAASQCSLFDNSRDALFITYEKTAQVTTDDGKIHKGVVLRLHNNSTCSVLITTGSAEKFIKPLPDNPTIMQRLKTEIEYELPDGVLVPEVQYRYRTSCGFEPSLGGDSFFRFGLRGGRTILFEVPLVHFGSKMRGGIEVVFEYEWERQNRAKFNFSSVEYTVYFGGGNLPSEAVKQRR